MNMPSQMAPKPDAGGLSIARVSYCVSEMSEPYSTWREGIQLRNRRVLNPEGRTQVASDELRDNLYRDRNNVRQLVTPLKPWHERIVDFLLLNPNATMTKVAQSFNVTIPWMSQLMRTDAFREYYSQRMQEHQKHVSQRIVSKMQGVAEIAFDKLAEKLETTQMPVGELRDVANMAVKSLGYGAQLGGVRVNVQTSGNGMTVVGVASEVLQRAREAHARARAANTETIEHDPNEYRRVTAAMDVNPGEVHDALVVNAGAAEESNESEAGD